MTRRRRGCSLLPRSGDGASARGRILAPALVQSCCHGIGTDRRGPSSNLRSIVPSVPEPGVDRVTARIAAITRRHARGRALTGAEETAALTELAAVSDRGSGRGPTARSGVLTGSGHRQDIARSDGADRWRRHVGARVATFGGHGTKEITPCPTRRTPAGARNGGQAPWVCWLRASSAVASSPARWARPRVLPRQAAAPRRPRAAVTRGRP